MRQILFIYFGLFLCYGSVFSQNYNTNPDSALQIILSKIDGAKLTLAQAQQIAMENSAEIKENKARLDAAEAVVQRERGIFDPELFARLEYIKQNQPSASFFAGADVLSTRQTNGLAGIRMNLPIGTYLEASLNSTRLKTNSSFAALNPQYDLFGQLTLRQPLLNGFMASSRKQLSSAEKALDAARETYQQAVIDFTAQIESSYWDLYAAERDYAVQYLVRDRAQAILDETKIRAKTGLVGPGQVANAEVFLAEQELLLIDRQEQLDQLSDKFAASIGQRPAENKTRFIMTSKPSSSFETGNVDALVAQAVEKNRQLQAIQNEKESLNLLANAADWEALPSIDLLGSLGSSGLSGSAQDVLFGGQVFRSSVDGDFSDALSQVTKRDYPSWSVGIEISYPIGSRSGRGERNRLQAQVVQSEQRYISAKRTLEEQIRSTCRELQNGSRRLDIARNAVGAAQEQVRIGLIEYRNGRSTAFELVRLGADFAAAQQRYSQELVRNAKAAAKLKQLTSGTFEPEKTN
ncbi:MAG: TolC family protein [Calditrichae bacterium]|nr:TolC family protein [Calditrichota bacterium]MCB9058167.1 TolC family protein [Calditrichia bacterium]